MKQFAALLIVLGSIAALAPPPWYLTDRDTYERVGREIVVPDCSDLHCFRVLVPVVVEHLPLPVSSWVKWKIYTVLVNALAAFLAGRVALAFGLSARAATLATWMSALGFGSLFTLFDPHTADPLMFALGPLLTLLLLTDRVRRASAVSALGVFAKEFAAAPLWIGAAVAWLGGRRTTTVRLLAAALAVTTLWAVFQVTMLTVFDYSYGNSHSVELTKGAYFVHWVREVGPRTALSSLLTEYGALYLLIPAGLLVAPLELRRWTLASVPAALVFAYVQQPDRALWNFHFIATPLAAIVIAGLPSAGAWLFVAGYAGANLRIGAQLPFAPSSRFGLMLSALIAAIAVVQLWRERHVAAAPRPPRVADRPLTPHERRGLTWLAAATAAAMLFAGVVMLDASMHRRVERDEGVNKWGYRGPVLKHKAPEEIRVAVVGGPFAFGAGVGWQQSFPAVLEQYVHQGWRTSFLKVPLSVVNLATPSESPATFADTLRDYDYISPDVVVIVAEPASGTTTSSWRRQSWIFRATGYLPALPGNGRELEESPRARTERLAANDAQEIIELVTRTVAAGRRAIVVMPPYRAQADMEQARALAAALASRFPDTSRVRSVNLDRAVDMSDPAVSADGVRLTAAGHERVTEALTVALLDMLRR